ncbi:hypothetical protein R1flu_007004 [Riccia fluitans]|uniref:Uncharacterized protein n=1 Tax=Riccia fluitans TaxID=41844 RepID=A0ABD1YXL9_9MARC
MEAQGGQQQRRRERKRGGGVGSGGIVVGIATVVVVGLAGKLLQRFHSFNRAKNNDNNNATKAAARDSVERKEASEGQSSNAAVLKKVLSIVGDRVHTERDTIGLSDTISNPASGSNPIETPEKGNADCDDQETPVTGEEFEDGRSRSISTDRTENPKQHSSFDGDSTSDSRKDEVHDQHFVENVVNVSEAAVVESKEGLSSGDPIIQSVRHHDCEAAAGGNMEEIRADAPEVFPRTFESESSQGLENSKSVLSGMKLTVEVSWEEKSDPAADELESDAAETADSLAGPETPLEHDNAEVDDSKGFRYRSESELEPESENLGTKFVDASDAGYLAATGDKLEPEYVNAETQIEDSRMESQEAGSESTDWPRAISFKEFLASVQASASAEIEEQLPSDDDSASAVSAEERGEDQNSSPHTESDEAEPQGDRDYFPCDDPSVVHDEAKNEIEDSDSVYEESHGVLDEDESSPSNQNRVKETPEVVSESKFRDFSKEMEEPAADSEEKFEDCLPYPELDSTTTTPSAEDGEATDAEEEDEDTTITSVKNEEENNTTELDDQNARLALGLKEEEVATVGNLSSLMLPSKPFNPKLASKHGKGHNMARDSISSNIAKSAIITSLEFTSTSRKSEKLEMTRERSSAMEMLRMAVLIALIAAIIFLIREHQHKPLRHAA